jgi:AraC family transcriptional regulator
MQIINHEPVEYRFKQQYHLLIAVEQGVCYDAETFIEGLPISSVRNCSHRLMFVPAGRIFSGAQRPRLLTRAICLYIDPHTVPVDPDIRFAEAELQPRLLFEDAGLWETIRKLKAQIGSADPAARLYAEALGGLLSIELLRLQQDGALAPRPSQRGGACRVATEARHGFHRGAPFPGRFARRARRSGAVEPISFSAILQAILRGAAVSLLDGPAD